MTTISPSFRLSDVTIVRVDGDDEAKWTLGLAVVAKPRRSIRTIKDRFIYVFRRAVGSTSAKLYAEYFASTTGLLFFCDGFLRETFDLGDIEIEMKALGTNEVSVPEDINGSLQECFIFGSRIRLSSSAIDRLVTSTPRAAQWFQVVPVSADGALFVPVLDPLAVAQQLNRHYQEACDALLNATTTYFGQDANTAERVRMRSKSLLLAKLLDASIKNARAKTFIDAYDKEIASLINVRDTRGAALTKFLRSKLMEFTEELYATQPDDFDGFLNAFGPACERLNECPNGRARLGDWLRVRPEWLSKFVLPDADLPEDTFQVVRKASAAVAQIWLELGPALFALNPKSAPLVLESGIQHVTRKLIWMRRVDNVLVNREFTVTSPVTKARYEQVVLIENLEDWAQSTKAAADVLERMNRLVEVANLILAASELVSGGNDPGFKALNLIGAGCDTIVAFQALGQLSKKKLLTVAAISAGIDAVLAARDAKSAYDIDDGSAAIGFTSVSLGSALMFLGFASAATGVGASATIVGLPLGVVLGVGGAILVAAGYVVAIFSADSQIDTFVKHCRFGDAVADPGTAATWSQGPFLDWKNGEQGLNAQIAVLYTLLAAFTVEPESAQTFVIRPGLMMPESFFKVSAQLQGIGTTAGDVPAQCTLEIRPQISRIVQTSGDAIELNKTSFISDQSRNAVSIRVSLSPVRPSGDFSFLRARSQARVRLQLSDGQQIPQKADLRFAKNDDAFPGGGRLESKDF